MSARDRLDAAIKGERLPAVNAVDKPRIVPLELLEDLRAELEELDDELALDVSRGGWISESHVSAVIDGAEAELRDVLAGNGDVEVLALMRFAVILDRGAAMLALAGAPAPAQLAKMPDAQRLELARGLRAVANSIDPQ